MVVFWNCCNLCFCSWDAVFNGFNDGIYGFYDEGVNDGIIKKINEMIIYRMCVVVEDISVCGWCDVWGFMLKVILFYFVFLIGVCVDRGENVYFIYVLYVVKWCVIG